MEVDMDDQHVHHHLSADHYDTDVIRSSSARRTGWRHPRAMWALLTLLFILNVAVISLAFVALSMEKGGQDDRHQCPSSAQQGLEPKRVLAPLCVPCEDEWLTGQVERGVMEDEEEEKKKEKEVVVEEVGGWRRYKDDDEGERDMCCPLELGSVSSALGQIYDSVLEEEQRKINDSPTPTSSWRSFYTEPTNTEERVLFANNHKPSAHVTALSAYREPDYYASARKMAYNRNNNTSSNRDRAAAAKDAAAADDDNRLLTFGDWPLRFEPYRSTTRGYVQKLTWGLAVPVTGLYRVHSTVNFYFSGYSQDTRQRGRKDDRAPFNVIHRLSRYRRATGVTAELTQRNQTVSGHHSDGLTSFLVTLQHLEVGDVISVTLSHRAALAMRDRWHSQGLFLLQ